METHDILYETLSPLDANAADTPPPPPSSSSSEIEPYVVLRNQIALSSAETPIPETPAVDYFSLDLNEPEDVKQSSVLATPKTAAAAKVLAPAAASERTLEGSWFRANSGFKSPMLRLHKEILDFCDFLSPTPEEQESRNAAIKAVSDVINYIWSDAKVEVFGSFKTGLYLPSSDVDVVILGSCVTSPKLGLQALSKALSQKGIAKKIQVIAKARVPIIKFVEKKSGFSFDVSFDAHNGPKAAEFIKDAVSRWPPLRPLCLILKVFLQQRELNEVYTGGIGSYALLAMLIAMLRTQQENQASPEHNLGILLVRFFDMYGCKLNTVDVGVSCRSGGSFYQKVSRGFTVDGRPSLISIEDPQDPDNDIGKNSFNYYQAKSAFSMAFTSLTNTKALLRLGPNRSILSAIIRPDAVLLERKGGSARKPAYNNLFSGSAEPMQQLFSEQQDIYCNWQLNDEEEEPLPRGNGILGDNIAKSSGKKRKVLKEKKSSKSKRGADEGVEENGSIEPKRKKHSRKSYQNGGYGDGYSPYKEGSSNWSRHR